MVREGLIDPQQFDAAGTVDRRRVQAAQCVAGNDAVGGPDLDVVHEKIGICGEIRMQREAEQTLLTDVDHRAGDIEYGPFAVSGSRPLNGRDLPGLFDHEEIVGQRR